MAGAQWNDMIAGPMAAAALCALLVLPARAIGHEVAQGFRRLLGHVISCSDFLFDLVTQSQAAAVFAKSPEPWGARQIRS